MKGELLCQIILVIRMLIPKVATKSIQLTAIIFRTLIIDFISDGNLIAKKRLSKCTTDIQQDIISTVVSGAVLLAIQDERPQHQQLSRLSHE